MKISRNLIPACLLALLLAGRACPPARGDSLNNVKHVVILMQENRSFDHYFGTFRGVRGFNDPNILRFQNGCSDLFQPLGGTNFAVPILLTNTCTGGGSNLEDSDDNGRNDGWWDDWVPNLGTDGMVYYNTTNLPFYYSLADHYTICDNNFCAFPGPTFPNRICLFSGMIDPDGTAGGPVVNNNIPTNGLGWTTYPERLQAAGISWKVYRPAGDWFGDALQWFAQYQNARPGNPLYDRGMAEAPGGILPELAADVSNNTLPQVSWLIPDNLAASEHGPYDLKLGENFVGQILSTIFSNPALATNTVFILTYDENGGYFDHIPAPAPAGLVPGEHIKNTPIGLGIRVPMIIVSPWTRGGRVCSQVFDHTSIIRFLETWTGVGEPNISAWRRQVCGDLTSAFDFNHPDFSPVNLPLIPATYADEYILAPVPAWQYLPVQEPGVRTACPLPYQPDGSGTTPGTNQFSILLTNAGTASVHLALYPNAARTDGPWQYDVPAGTAINDSYAIPPQAGGAYDFTCYGPNGFQRRFAGNANLDAGRINVFSRINPNAGISVTLLNSATNTVNFTIADNVNGGTASVYTLSAASATNAPFPGLSGNNGWYDLTVTASTDSTFLRRLAGHVENGAFSMTEIPAIVGNPLNLTTNPVPPAGFIITNATGSAAVLTNSTGSGTSSTPINSGPVITSINDLVANFIAQNAAPVTNAGPPVVAIESFGTNCALIYPGWTTNYVVETTVGLAPAAWFPATISSTTISNWTVVILPQTNATQFFRLRR